MKVRILTVTTLELGWSTYATTVEAAFADRTDHEVVHLALEPPFSVRLAGAKVAGRSLTGRLDSHYRRTLMAGRWMRNEVRRSVELDDFDVVHVTPHLAAAGLLSVGDRPPLSVALDATVRQSKSSRNGISGDEADRRHAPLREVERKILDASSSVMCLSSWARDAVAAETGRTEGLVVVPPAVRSTYRPDRTIAPSGRVQIVFVGNAWERKGGPDLLATHQRELVDVADLHICSAGAPTDRHDPNVYWHGPVPRDRLLGEVLPQMDIFAMPTRSDMSPWAVAEALGAGLPAVTIEMAGIGELVEHDASGLLSAPGDLEGFSANLRRLVVEPTTRERLAAGARAAADGRLSLGSMAASMLSCWEAAGVTT